MPTTRATELAQVGSLVSADPSASTVTVSGSVVTNAGTAAAPAVVPTGDLNTGMFFPAADTIAFAEGGAEAMRIDSSGNVGIGANSPAFGSGSGVELSRSGVATFRATSGGQGVEFRNNAGSAEIDTRGAYPIILSTNQTERLRIDSSGRVGIGTTSIGASLDIAKSDNTGSVSDFPSLRVTNTNSTQGNGTSTYNYARIDVKSGNGTVFADFGTRYDSSYSGAYIGTETSHPVTLQTGGTERLRITDNGAILFAKNTTDLGTVGYRYDTTGESYYSLSATANTTVTNAIYSTGASAYRFYVGLGGTVYATNTTISAISDIRLKENIRDINVGLDSIMALKPRLFDWKSGKGQDTKNVRGFIAQEIEEVFPDLVDEWKDPAPEGEEPYKSVRQDLIPVLVKAIQEQQAMIVELQSKVAALEAA